MTTPKIACPYCGDLRSKVYDCRPPFQDDGVDRPRWPDKFETDARASSNGDGFWRRRRCVRCGGRYVTTEILIAKYRPPSSTGAPHGL